MSIRKLEGICEKCNEFSQIWEELDSSSGIQLTTMVNIDKCLGWMKMMMEEFGREHPTMPHRLWALLGHKQPTPFNALSDIPWDWCCDVYEKKMIILTQNYIAKLKKDGHLITPWYYQTSDGLRWAVALVLQDEAGSIHVNIVMQHAEGLRGILEGIDLPAQTSSTRQPKLHFEVDDSWSKEKHGVAYLIAVVEEQANAGLS